MIDLHIHSTASDGSFSPSEILDLANQLQLAAIAITDHDSLAGVKDALALKRPPTLRFLSGIEISAAPPAGFDISGSFHLLGYDIRIADPALNSEIEKLQQARRNRNPLIIQKLGQLGFDLDTREMAISTAGGQLGRPHIARQMVKQGYVDTIDDAFDRYLGTGKPAYVGKQRISCKAAVQLILAAGGIPVMAHPFLYETGESDRIARIVKTLKDKGLEGIEAYYPDHTAEQTSHYLRLARKYGLYVTGGTDFHGTLKPDIQMGSGRGDFAVDFEHYQKLVQGCR